MNNIFEKNISALREKNPKLAEELIQHIPTEVPQVVNENGFYNLIYRELRLHNQTNPLLEAQEIFSYVENTPVSIHLVYGLGLGYLFQVTSLNSQGAVILYEPDLSLLKIVFTLVDFSNDILKQNVFICADLEAVSDAVYRKSSTKNTPQMLILPSQKELYKDTLPEVVSTLQNLIGAYSLDLKYTKEKFYPSLKMLIGNIPNILNETPLAHFKDFYKGKTAIVISAGPTLDRNIVTLKKYRDNVIIFCVGTALKTLIKNGIEPDFLCTIETFDSSRQLADVDLSRVNFITEPYSHPNLRNFEFKNRFSHICANSPINHFWQEICGEEIEEYWSKGTVSYTALNCARILGCQKIVLVGQDLAYIEGQCYSKDSAYKDLICERNPETNEWEIKAKDLDEYAKNLSNNSEHEARLETAKNRLKTLNASMHKVKGINGDMIPTESVYATFIRPLSEFTEHFNDREYINTSMVGAQIDGFKNMTLEDALKGSAKIELEDMKNDFCYDRARIVENLKEKLTVLKSAITLINEGERIAKNINNDIKRYKSPNVEILKNLKKMSLNYLMLSNDFCDKSKLYDFITASDKIDLDYEMKMTKEFTSKSILNISSKINTYYSNAKAHIAEIEGLILDVIGKIE